ncbi:MAG TPA: hypothetical protein P5181_01700 [Dermatophilaceae bacterium]|nr:hypothetical protein [Dermatophilaceae bacterium]
MGGPEHPDLDRLAAAAPAQAADLIARLLDPRIVLGLTLAVTCLRQATSPAAGLGWLGVTALSCIGVPWLMLVLLLHRGRVADAQVVQREQRRLPLVAALASIVVGLVALHLLDAPRPIVALVAAILASGLAITVISWWHKASIHTGVAVAAGAVLAQQVSGWVWMVGMPLAAAVGWARWRAGRHTGWQVVSGALVGLAVGGGVFGVLR